MHCMSNNQQLVAGQRLPDRLFDLHGGVLAAFDSESGECAWIRPVKSASAGPLVAGGCVLYGSEGLLVAVDEATGAPLWEVDLGEGIWQVEANDKGVVVVSDGATTNPIPTLTGTLSWSASMRRSHARLTLLGELPDTSRKQIKVSRNQIEVSRNACKSSRTSRAPCAPRRPQRRSQLPDPRPTGRGGPAPGGRCTTRNAIGQSGQTDAFEYIVELST